ncbi:hypothetical protein Tco_0789450 [Tanacetum coccineum]
MRIISFLKGFPLFFEWEICDVMWSLAELASDLSSIYLLVHLLNFSPEIVKLGLDSSKSIRSFSTSGLCGCFVMPFLRIFSHLLDGYLCVGSSHGRRIWSLAIDTPYLKTNTSYDLQDTPYLNRKLNMAFSKIEYGIS